MMKTLKPNNYDQASKELLAFDKNVQFNIDTIKDADKHFFHVIMLKKINNPIKQKYETKAHIGMFNELGYNKIKKSFGFQGYTKIILLHNPNEMEVAKPSGTSEFHRKQIEREIELELQKEFEAKKKELVDKKLAEKETEDNQDNTETGSDPDKKTDDDTKTDTGKDNTVKPFDLDKMTVAELKLFAEANKIDLEKKTAKSEIKTIIEKWFEQK